MGAPSVFHKHSQLRNSAQAWVHTAGPWVKITTMCALPWAQIQVLHPARFSGALVIVWISPPPNSGCCYSLGWGLAPSILSGLWGLGYLQRDLSGTLTLVMAQCSLLRFPRDSSMGSHRPFWGPLIRLSPLASLDFLMELLQRPRSASQFASLGLAEPVLVQSSFPQRPKSRAHQASWETPLRPFRPRSSTTSSVKPALLLHSPATPGSHLDHGTHHMPVGYLFALPPSLGVWEFLQGSN